LEVRIGVSKSAKLALGSIRDPTRPPAQASRRSRVGSFRLLLPLQPHFSISSLRSRRRTPRAVPKNVAPSCAGQTDTYCHVADVLPRIRGRASSITSAGDGDEGTFSFCSGAGRGSRREEKGSTSDSAHRAMKSPMVIMEYPRVPGLRRASTSFPTNDVCRSRAWTRRRSFLWSAQRYSFMRRWYSLTTFGTADDRSTSRPGPAR